MKKIKSFIAYIMAFVSVFLILILFLNFNEIAVAISKLPFMKINPLYSGGEVTQIIEKENYKLEIHEPVFPSLIKKVENGFIQLHYIGEEFNSVLDSIDYNNDNIVDFIVYSEMDTLKIDKMNEQITQLYMNLNSSKGKLLRIGINRDL